MIKNRKSGEIKYTEVKSWDDLTKKRQYENDTKTDELNAREKAIKEREKAVKEREDALNGKKSSEGGNTTKGGTKNEKTPPKEEKPASGGSKTKSESKQSETTVKPVKEVINQGKKETEKIVNDSQKSNKSSNWYNDSDYKKRVNSLLAEIDKRGWDDYYSERKRGGS